MFLLRKKLKTVPDCDRGEEVHTLEDSEDNLEVLTDVGKQVPTSVAEEVPTLEVPTKVGEEQADDGDRQAVRCQNKTRAGDDLKRLEEL